MSIVTEAGCIVHPSDAIEFLEYKNGHSTWACKRCGEEIKEPEDGCGG